MNKLRKVVSAGPSGGRYGIIKWIIALVFILLAGGGIGGVFNQENDSSLSTVSQSNFNVEDALQAFDGNNFEHLPKMVKLPVIYDRVVDGDTQMVTIFVCDI